MTTNHFSPEDKFDTEAVERLKTLSLAEVEPLLPKLMEGLQDGNWPVFVPLSRFLSTLPVDVIGPHLMKVMYGTDYEWKYFLISAFGHNEKEKLYPEFHTELLRLATQPTPVEINCELQWMAQHVLQE